GRALRQAQALRPAGMVVLALHPHLLPDRLPQPRDRAGQLGVGVLELPAARADHPGRQRAPRMMRTIENGPVARAVRLFMLHASLLTPRTTPSSSSARWL